MIKSKNQVFTNWSDIKTEEYSNNEYDNKLDNDFIEVFVLTLITTNTSHKLLFCIYKE